MKDLTLTKHGVPDLNKAWPTKPKPKPAPPTAEDIVDVHDLLYDDSNEIRAEIFGQFSEARLEGDYDEIHEERLSVDVRTTRLHWYRFLVRSGLASISFSFQISLRGGEMRLVEAAMDAERPGWRNRQKK